MNSFITNTVNSQDVEEGQLPDDEGQQPVNYFKGQSQFQQKLDCLTIFNFSQTQTQQQRKPQPLAQIQVQPSRPSPEEDSSSEIIFQTVTDKGHGKSDYDYHDRKKKKIHKQDHKQKNYPNATNKQRQKNSVDRQKRNEKKITTSYEKEKDAGEVLEGANTSKPNQYQHPLPPFYPPPTYMYQMPMPMRAHIPMPMAMAPMPPHQMYLQYPPAYMHPNQYPFNNGGPMKQMPMQMNINQYQMNNSIPQHQQISVPPQPHQIPMPNPNNQYKIPQNIQPQPREYTMEKQPESLYKNQQISLPQNNNPYPSYQTNYPNVGNQGYNQNFDKPRQFSKYQDFKNEKNEKVDKRKEVLNDVKKQLKKNLKIFTNQEQSDILQALKSVIKFNNKKNQSSLQKHQTIQTSLQAMEINSYERSIITLEKLLASGQNERRQLINKLLETLQLQDILTGLKERRIANKLIGDQAELKKLAQVFARDPRKMIS